MQKSNCRKSSGLCIRIGDCGQQNTIESSPKNKEHLSR